MGFRRRPLILSVTLLLVALSAGCDGDPPSGTQARTSPSAGAVPSDSPAPSESGDKKDGGDDGKDDEKDDDVLTEKVPGGATLTRLPPKAEEICIQGPPLSRACPLLVPQVRGTSYLIDSFGRPGGRFQVLELAAGAASNKDPARNAPPRFAHVVIEVGKPGFLIDLGEPAPNKLPLEELLDQDLDQAQDVTANGWGETLMLAPSFPSGGAHGSHLIYRWKGGGYEYRISLHGWAPASSLVNTLRAIVRSAKSP